jgi:sensory rhodopsin
MVLFTSTDTTIQFVAFWCMFASFIAYFIELKKEESGKRIYHAYTCGVVGFASVAYLIMALGEGYILVGDTPFQYVRYLDWIVTTPLLLLDLAGLAGVSADDQIAIVLFDVMMILAGLAAGSSSDPTTSLYLWGLGIVFYIPIVYDLVVVFSESAKKVGDAAASTYKTLMLLTVVLWSFYPVVFLAAQTDYLTQTGEILSFCILDVLSKCGFGFILLFSRDSLAQAATGDASSPLLR